MSKIEANLNVDVRDLARAISNSSWFDTAEFINHLAHDLKESTDLASVHGFDMLASNLDDNGKLLIDRIVAAVSARR